MLVSKNYFYTPNSNILYYIIWRVSAISLTTVGPSNSCICVSTVEDDSAQRNQTKKIFSNYIEKSKVHELCSEVIEKDNTY